MTIKLVLIEDIQIILGRTIAILRDSAALGVEGSTDFLHLQVALSIAEYLKDAQRWHYVEGNTIPNDLSGTALRKFVDEELDK